MKVQVLLLIISHSFASKTLINVENHNGGVYVTFGEPLDDQSKFFFKGSNLPKGKAEISMTYSSTFKKAQIICLNNNSSRKINGQFQDVDLSETTHEIIAFDPIEDFKGEVFCFSVTALFTENNFEGTIFIKQVTLDKEKNYLAVTLNYDQGEYIDVKMKVIYFDGLEQKALGDKRMVKDQKLVSIDHIDVEDTFKNTDKDENKAKDKLDINFPSDIYVIKEKPQKVEATNNINSKNQIVSDIDENSANPQQTKNIAQQIVKDTGSNSDLVDEELLELVPTSYNFKKDTFPFEFVLSGLEKDFVSIIKGVDVISEKTIKGKKVNVLTTEISSESIRTLLLPFQNDKVFLISKSDLFIITDEDL